MDDPVRFHPTRAEQLDIMTSIIAEIARPGDAVLDLGCGTGYLEYLLAQKRRDLAVTGVDLEEHVLAEAAGRFAGLGDYHWVHGDLQAPRAIELPASKFRFVVSCLTIHDLTEEEKQALIAWIAELLAEDGVFLMMDRIRLTERPLFPLQVSLWNRLEQVHGVGMYPAETFERYEAQFAPYNNPAPVDDFRDWFRAHGMAGQVLHQHGNVVVFGAMRS